MHFEVVFFFRTACFVLNCSICKWDVECGRLATSYSEIADCVLIGFNIYVGALYNIYCILCILLCIKSKSVGLILKIGKDR